MATRPTIPISIRAADTIYSTGEPLLVGTPTKISRTGPDIAEGYKVDTAGSPAPVFAQNKNFEDNRTDQWLEWVSNGSDSNTFTSNIVETDSSGDINVNGVNCANAQVSTNGISDGVVIQAFSGSKGLVLLRDGGSVDDGMNIISFDGASGPTVNLQSTNANGFRSEIRIPS